MSHFTCDSAILLNVMAPSKQATYVATSLIYSCKIFCTKGPLVKEMTTVPLIKGL
jgi:hypothetical protein